MFCVAKDVGVWVGDRGGARVGRAGGRHPTNPHCLSADPPKPPPPTPPTPPPSQRVAPRRLPPSPAADRSHSTPLAPRRGSTDAAAAYGLPRPRDRAFAQGRGRGGGETPDRLLIPCLFHRAEDPPRACLRCTPPHRGPTSSRRAAGRPPPPPPPTGGRTPPRGHPDAPSTPTDICALMAAG